MADEVKVATLKEVRYEDLTTDQLRNLVKAYENSVLEYKSHERAGHWYGNGHFYLDELVALNAWNRGHLRGAAPRKYDATEDLAFLYTELASIYRILFDRASA
jgi:hypothetical protein